MRRNKIIELVKLFARWACEAHRDGNVQRKWAYITAAKATWMKANGEL